MRRNAVIVLVSVLVGACTGARGVEPRLTSPATDDGSISTDTMVLGPVSTPRLVLTAEPVAVPSTTTTLPAPSIPAETTEATTTTVAPTTTIAASPLPPPAPGGPIATEPLTGTVALTFDDGPFDGWTETILDILDAYDVKATFFVSTYRLPAVAHLIPRIVAAGHSVQSHSDHHDDLTQMTADEVRLALTTSIQKLVEAGAPRPTCVRPPYGHTDDTVNAVAAELGLEVIGWTLNTLDYSLQDAQGVIDTTLTYVEPGDNILAHDQWAPVWETALPVVIEEISARQIGFSTICNVAAAPSEGEGGETTTEG